MVEPFFLEPLGEIAENLEFTSPHILVNFNQTGINMITALIRIMGRLTEHEKLVLTVQIFQCNTRAFVSLEAVLGPSVGYPEAVLFEGSGVINRSLSSSLIGIININSIAIAVMSKKSASGRMINPKINTVDPRPPSRNGGRINTNLVIANRKDSSRTHERRTLGARFALVLRIRRPQPLFGLLIKVGSLVPTDVFDVNTMGFGLQKMNHHVGRAQ